MASVQPAGERVLGEPSRAFQGEGTACENKWRREHSWRVRGKGCLPYSSCLFAWGILLCSLWPLVSLREHPGMNWGQSSLTLLLFPAQPLLQLQPLCGPKGSVSLYDDPDTPLTPLFFPRGGGLG